MRNKMAVTLIAVIFLFSLGTASTASASSPMTTSGMTWWWE